MLASAPAYALIAATSVIAQLNPPTAAPPLAGPRLSQPAADEKSTLLRFDFSGRVAPTDEPPEFEALKQLDLAPETAKAVEDLKLRRAKFMDDFVGGHINLLIKFGTAGATQNVPDLLMLTHEALGPLRPLVESGPLAARVRALLPTDQAQRYDAALAEYWRAVIADGEHTPDKHGNPPPPFAIIIKARLESFGREIEQSFKRIERSGDFLYTYLVGDLGLTGEPAARVRELFADFADAGGDNADDRTKALLGSGVLAHLTPDQTVKLVKRLKGLTGK